MECNVGSGASVWWQGVEVCVIGGEGAVVVRVNRWKQWKEARGIEYGSEKVGGCEGGRRGGVK